MSLGIVIVITVGVCTCVGVICDTIAKLCRPEQDEEE